MRSSTSEKNMELMILKVIEKIIPHVVEVSASKKLIFALLIASAFVISSPRRAKTVPSIPNNGKIDINVIKKV